MFDFRSKVQARNVGNGAKSLEKGEENKHLLKSQNFSNFTGKTRFHFPEIVKN